MQLFQHGVDSVYRIETVAGQNRTDTHPHAHFFRRVPRLPQQVKISAGRKHAPEGELRTVSGIGVGAHRRNDAAELQRRIDGAGASDADDFFHTVMIVKLMGIDPDGRHAHAGCHDRHRFAVIGSGIALDPAQVVDKFRCGKVGFRNEFRPQGIARHQDCRGKISGVG